MIIDDLFSPVYGKFCWNAKKGYGSFLTFEFGEPHLDVKVRSRSTDAFREKVRRVNVHGDWHLWIYLCKWEIYSHDTLKASNQASNRDINRAMLRLDGQVLTNVEVNTTCSTTFTFDLGDRLETMPNIPEFGEDSEQWMLFEPNGRVFTLRADQKFSYQPGNTIPTDERWQPLF
jgi:hypothetical protein